MSSLDQIKITVAGMENRAIVHSLLTEVVALLERYLKTGEVGELNLLSQPLSPADLQALEQTLGRGEIEINLQVMGVSQIIETQFSGVWRVIHKDDEGRLVAHTIEIAPVPSIVEVHSGEMRRSTEQIKQLVEK